MEGREGVSVLTHRCVASSDFKFKNAGFLSCPDLQYSKQRRSSKKLKAIFTAMFLTIIIDLAKILITCSITNSFPESSFTVIV